MSSGYTEQYEDRTRVFRNSEDTQTLFVSFRKPHKPVSSAIARWLKELLHDASIDTYIQGPLKKSGSIFSMADLLKEAGLSRASTFEQFYHKPIMGKNEILVYAQQSKPLNVIILHAALPQHGIKDSTSIQRM